MEEVLDYCSMQFLYISVIVVLCILALIVGRKGLRKVPGLIKAFRIFTPRPHPVMMHFHQQVGELRRATIQIAKDWAEMTNLMTVLREQQCIYVHRLDGDFQAMGDYLHNTFHISLEEECLRNDQRFKRISKMVGGFRDDFQDLKEVFLKLGELLEKDQERKQVVDGWTQTAREMVLKKKQRDGHAKTFVQISGEQESSKSVLSFKRVLAEFLKEAKKRLAHEKEELMSNLKSMFIQLAADRKDIKNSIASVFSTATQQNQKYFEQFSYDGHEAMKCLAVFGEKSGKIASARFQASAEKLRDIFLLLRDLNFKVVSIKTILDNIDGHLDDIYQKLEFGNKKNMDNYEILSNSLKTAADEWEKKYSSLEKMTRQSTDVTERITDMLSNSNNDGASKTSTGMDEQPYSQMTLKPSSDLTLLNASCSKGMVTLLEGYPVSDDLPTLLRTCFAKMQSLKNITERGTVTINRSMESLIKNVQFLSDLVENRVNKLKKLTVVLPEGEMNVESKQELLEFIRDIVSLKNGDESPSVKVHESATGESTPRQPRDSNEYPNNLKTVLKANCVRASLDNSGQTIIRGNINDVQKRPKN